MATAPKTTTDTSAAALSAALAAPAVEKDEFADAFAGFTTEKQPDPAPTTAAASAAEGADGKEAPAEGDDTQTEIEGAPEPATGDGETKTAEQIAAEAKAAEDAAKAAKPPVTDDAMARLADMIAQRTQPVEKPAQTQQPAAPAPLYTDAEVTQLQAFYKEWPEVAPAVQVLLKGAMTNVTNEIFTEVARVLGPKLKLLDQLADGFQYNQLKTAVPDFDDTLEEQVTAWAKTLPPYLQAAVTNVMQNGSPDDISDVVKRYRQETGTKAPEGDRTTEGTKTPTPAEKAAPLSTAAKKAAAALAPVNSKRTGSTQVEPQGFDEAFEVYSKAG